MIILTQSFIKPAIYSRVVVTIAILLILLSKIMITVITFTEL